jgi:hypothetical protein
MHYFMPLIQPNIHLLEITFGPTQVFLPLVQSIKGRVKRIRIRIRVRAPINHFPFPPNTSKIV